MGDDRRGNGLGGSGDPQKEENRVFHTDLLSSLIMGVKSEERTQQAHATELGKRPEDRIQKRAGRGKDLEGNFC